MSQGTRIGVDIGGTFTELVLIDDDSGALTVGKLLTTPENPARAVEAGITALIRDAGASAQSVKTLVHATTLATNAIIERRGGKAAPALDDRVGCERRGVDESFNRLRARAGV